MPSELSDQYKGRLGAAKDARSDPSASDDELNAAARLAAIVSSSDDAIISKTLDGIITSWNAGATRIFGYESDEMIGQPITRLIPDELLYEEAEIIAQLRNGQRVEHFETTRITKDGRRVDISLTVSPVHNTAGAVIGASKVARDISDRKRADTQLALLAAIVESSQDAIISKSLDGTISSWNRGATNIFGYEADEMIGQPITRIVPPELIGEEEQIIAKLRRGERIEHFETTRIAKNGRRIDISIAVSPVHDGTGKVIGASKVARDITERKRAEAMRQLLLNELNHRVKNTLANVQSIVQHTLRRTADPEAFAASFSGRIGSLARAHSLLTSTTWQGADLRELIRDQLLHGSADEARLTISGPSVKLDSQMTVHVALMLHELGTNSAKYGAMSVKDGSIAVSWTVRGSELRLVWVERGGKPVAAPVRRGFGLTLIEQSALSQNGSAHVSWEAEGISWEITLPLSQAATFSEKLAEAEETAGNAALAKGAKSEAGQTTLAGRRLLVVEDEPLIGLDIVCSLQDEGADVVGPAATEEEALKLMVEGRFDAALLDANLHGKPVDQIAAALTRHNIPFAFVSGHGREGLPKSFGKAPLVSKPFTQHQLLQAVRQLIEPGASATRIARGMQQ